MGSVSITLTLPLAPAFGQEPAPRAQVAGVQRFDVGDRVVTALADGYFDLPLDVFLNATPEEANELLRAAFFDATGQVRTSVNAFLVQGPDGTVLVDTGGGPAMAPTVGRLPQHLQAAGLAPADIGIVALTHLHADHFGGLLGADGAPAFPNAKVLVHEREIAFWNDDQMKAQAPEQFRSAFDAARAVLRAYSERVEPLTADGPVAGGLQALLLPGHTPGHTGFTVGSGDDAVLIWGDVVHSSPLQFPRPDWSMVFDVDPDAARETRRRALDMAAADRLRVAGMHLFFPGVGHVAKAGEGYEFEPSRWDYEL